jgi:alginate production protein
MRPEVSRAGLVVVLTLAALLAVTRASSAQRVFDPEAPPDTRYRLTPALSFGADIEIDYSFRRNLDLDPRQRDALELVTPELSLAWSFDPIATFQAFFNVALARTVALADHGRRLRHSDEDVTIEIKEAYVRAGRLAEGPSALIGRQRFDDERKWLYDEDLDAVRLRYVGGPLVVELSASRNGVVRTQWGGPDDREDINNYIAHASYVPRPWIELEGYAIVREGRKAAQGTPVFFGVRSRGEPIQDLDYWLELGYVAGRENRRHVRGWGLDLGVTYEWQIQPRPSVTLGFALGSGDRNPEDSTDRSFRQTGLQRNEWDFGGSTEFKYYGEIFDPELSNLAIVTAGVGIRPTEKWSVDLVYHYFEQHQPATTIRNAAIGAEPSGRSKRLGSELDLIIGFVEILDRIEVKAIVGYFFPGAALPERAGAWGMGVEVQFRF